MKLGKIKNLISAVSPAIGSALGTPLAGVAINTIASALGCAPNERSIENAMQNMTAEQVADLKKAEKEFEVKMKELDVDLYSIQTKDIQDARAKFNNDWTPKFLGILCLVGFFGYIGMVTMFPQPEDSDDIVMLVIGSITGIATAVISFYFGSSDKK